MRRKGKRHAHSVATTAGWAAGASKASARWEPAPERLSLLLFSPHFPGPNSPWWTEMKILRDLLYLSPTPHLPRCGDALWPLGLSNSRRFPPYSVRQDSRARPASRSGGNASLRFFFPCVCLLPVPFSRSNFRAVVLKRSWILLHLSL